MEAQHEGARPHSQEQRALVGGLGPHITPAASLSPEGKKVMAGSDRKAV